jgi:hypothetical protein
VAGYQVGHLFYLTAFVWRRVGQACAQAQTNAQKSWFVSSWMSHFFVTLHTTVPFSALICWGRNATLAFKESQSRPTALTHVRRLALLISIRASLLLYRGVFVVFEVAALPPSHYPSCDVLTCYAASQSSVCSHLPKPKEHTCSGVIWSNPSIHCTDINKQPSLGVRTDGNQNEECISTPSGCPAKLLRVQPFPTRAAAVSAALPARPASAPPRSPIFSRRLAPSQAHALSGIPVTERAFDPQLRVLELPIHSLSAAPSIQHMDALLSTSSSIYETCAETPSAAGSCDGSLGSSCTRVAEVAQGPTIHVQHTAPPAGAYHVCVRAHSSLEPSASCGESRRGDTVGRVSRCSRTGLPRPQGADTRHTAVPLAERILSTLRLPDCCMSCTRASASGQTGQTMPDAVPAQGTCTGGVNLSMRRAACHGSCGPHRITRHVTVPNWPRLNFRCSSDPVSVDADGISSPIIQRQVLDANNTVAFTQPQTMRSRRSCPTLQSAVFSAALPSSDSDQLTVRSVADSRVPPLLTTRPVMARPLCDSLDSWDRGPEWQHSLSSCLHCPDANQEAYRMHTAPSRHSSNRCRCHAHDCPVHLQPRSVGGGDVAGHRCFPSEPAPSSNVHTNDPQRPR